MSCDSTVLSDTNKSYCEACRLRHLAAKYGLSEGQAAALVADSHGVCCICGSAQVLCIDHDHATGQARGVLCRRCNTVLGLVDDVPERLLGLVAYLRDPPARRVL
jgi:hypothetical protein